MTLPQHESEPAAQAEVKAEVQEIPCTPTFVGLPLMLYGFLLMGLGFGAVTLGSVWNSIVLFLSPGSTWVLGTAFLQYSGLPVIAGILLTFIDLTFQLPHKRTRLHVRREPPQNTQLTVVLTAYNDEASIGLSVTDFLGHPKVERVLVIDNNSTDATGEVAQKAGATVIREEMPGYGSCVWRGLQEAVNIPGPELILLCEGDMTFRAADIDKFLAYIPHAEIINGTRIVEQLRERDTQLSTFIYYGNFAVGKLLELKHIGRGTFTDVGTTYKLCRKRALQKLLPHLDRRVNLEFNAHFLDVALLLNIDVVECPVTFFARVGKSKGGNVNNTRAFRTGLRMVAGLLFGWRRIAQHGPDAP